MSVIDRAQGSDWTLVQYNADAGARPEFGELLNRPDRRNSNSDTKGLLLAGTERMRTTSGLAGRGGRSSDRYPAGNDVI
jgi:hypothetical protein